MCDSCCITMPSWRAKCCNVPNPASLPPLPDDGVASALQHLTRSAHLDQSTDTHLFTTLIWGSASCDSGSELGFLYFWFCYFTFWTSPMSLLSIHSRAAVNYQLKKQLMSTLLSALPSVLCGNVIICKIWWQTCVDSQSHCWCYSSSSLHCFSKMYCSLVHLILIQGKCFYRCQG